MVFKHIPLGIVSQENFVKSETKQYEIVIKKQSLRILELYLSDAIDFFRISIIRDEQIFF